MESELPSPKQQITGAAVIFVAALALAGAFAIVTRATFDYDEFVVLMLGKAIAHGLTPYRDFTFFHPPGIILVLALMNPLIQHSWLWGRLPSVVVDAATCSLVYLIAIRLYRRQSVAIVAGLLCASSPIMLITGTRIFQDDYVGFFGLLALYLLLISPSRRFAVLAGISLALAFMFKFPAVLIGPACLVLAGKRRSPYLVGAAIVAVGILLIPLLAGASEVYIRYRFVPDRPVGSAVHREILRYRTVFDSAPAAWILWALHQASAHLADRRLP